MSDGENTRYAAGVDFGGTSVKIALVNSTGKLLREKRIVTKDLPSRDAWMDHVAAAIRDIQGEHALSGVGVGVPGFVDHERGYIYDLPNVPGWQGVHLSEMMESRLNLRVEVDNDVNAMALGECTFGAGRTYQHAIFLTLGTGVGGGLLINNRLYRGAFSMAGEVGHISIDRNGVPSAQGKGGVEQYVGNARFVAYARSLLESGRTSILDDLCGGDRSQLSPKLIKEAAVKGDELALELLHFYADCLATAMASMTYMVQPQAFIIGGGVAEDAALLFSLIREHLNQRLHPQFSSRIEIKQAELGNEAGMIGCATLAWMD